MTEHPMHALRELPPVILLSVFDGMGSAALILKDMGCRVSLYLFWEVDPACVALLQHHFPEVHVRGDFLRDDPKDVAAKIAQHDPSCTMVVLIIGAPPCPDFSQIHECPPGPKGVEGQQFAKFCSFATAVEGEIAYKKVGYFVENVLIADKSEADNFSTMLDCSAVAADAADFGLVGRPFGGVA